MEQTSQAVLQQQGINVEANALSAPITAQVQTKLVSLEEVSFHFRKDKDLEKANPDLVGKTKRETFKWNIPLLTVAGAIAALQASDKSTQLLVEAANNVIIDRARGLISDKVDNDTFNKETKQYNLKLTPEEFNLEDLNFLKIAMLPKSERGAGIPKEAWLAFVADYKETMVKPNAVALFPDRKPRTPEVLEKHGIILGSKFNQVRSRKDVIGQMLGFLDIWAQASENVEEHMQIYEHLTAKGKVLMEGESFEDL
jgi:hypothetical protein